LSEAKRDRQKPGFFIHFCHKPNAIALGRSKPEAIGHHFYPVKASLMLSNEQNQVQTALPESFILSFTPFFILYSLCPLCLCGYTIKKMATTVQKLDKNQIFYQNVNYICVHLRSSAVKKNP
jgi:hypothetical protein